MPQEGEGQAALPRLLLSLPFVPLAEILARLWLEIGSGIHRLKAFRHPASPAAPPFTCHPTGHPVSIHLTPSAHERLPSGLLRNLIGG
jgi:hypothetical protein